MRAIKVTKRDVEPLVSATFPEYTGRKFSVEFTERVTFYDTNYSGGTRNRYAALNMANGEAGMVVVPAPWVNVIEGSSVELTPDIVIVQHSMFCGKDLGICISAHPSRAPKFITGGVKWLGVFTTTVAT